jgi:hypothetical protein
MRTAMDIKRIHTLYTETHCVSHAATRLKGDNTVNSVLDCKVKRESQFTRKHSVTVQAEQTYQSVKNRNTVLGEIPGTTPDNIRINVTEDDGTERVLTLPGDGGDVAPPLAFVNDVKQDVKTCVLMEANEHSLEHIQTLIMQGRFLELTQLERTDATWKSFF